MNIRVLVVAAIRLFREGLVACLKEQRPEFAVTGVAQQENACDVLDAEHPDVVVVEASTRDALETVRALMHRFPDTKTIVFGLDHSDDTLVACMETGVTGCVRADGTLSELIDAIERASRDEVICPPGAAHVLFRRLADLAQGVSSGDVELTLTIREWQILELIGKDLSNKEIAQQLNVEVSTVKNHVHNILAKLHVDNRRKAVARVRHQQIHSSFRNRERHHVA